MARTITLRIEDEKYKLIKKHAEADNRSLSNYIETATLNFIRDIDYCDEFEMSSILSDQKLLQDLQKGSKDAKNKKGKLFKKVIKNV